MEAIARSIAGASILFSGVAFALFGTYYAPYINFIFPYSLSIVGLIFVTIGFCALLREIVVAGKTTKQTTTRD